MDKTFTYYGDLSTPLDYARWRLDDVDSQVTVDETGAPSPFLWDATYSALFERFGVQGGMYRAALTIAAKLSKEIDSFGEASGIRFALRDAAAHYRKMADEILQEPPYGATSDFSALVKTGTIKKGVTDSYTNYRRVVGYPVPTE